MSVLFREWIDKSEVRRPLKAKDSEWVWNVALTAWKQGANMHIDSEMRVAKVPLLKGWGLTAMMAVSNHLFEISPEDIGAVADACRACHEEGLRFIHHCTAMVIRGSQAAA